MTDIAEIEASFTRQAAGCRELGSPFTARLCEILLHRLDRSSAFGRRIFGWRGDPGADALALRACGALHALVRSGDAPVLAAAWPPAVSSDATITAAVAEAVPRFDDRLARFLDSPPQTNEAARSAVVLGGAAVVAGATGLPLDLLEIGASAGANLCFDRHRYDLAGQTWGAPDAALLITCDWQGTPPRLDVPLSVVGRAGCDRAPLDASSPADRARLLAYIWPDQRERSARLTMALDEVVRAGVRIEAADAADWIEARMAEPGRSGVTRLVFHTVVWQYLPAATRNRIDAAITEAGARATGAAPLAWLRMEFDGERGSAAVTATIWPGGETRSLGRADWHGRWVRWANTQS